MCRHVPRRGRQRPRPAAHAVVHGPRSPDMKVDTESPTAKRAQEGIIELLLANHPLDCPVCDKGGECPLQDQAFSHGPGESRYVEEKRHFEKPIPISDLVLLDRERCILCDRCTRFADEVAGDALIHFIERGNQTQVMTFPDEPFASYFSGNTVQICPVGALTAKPYRFKARPWDLERGREHVHDVLGRLPHRRCSPAATRCVRYLGVDSDAGQLGLAVRPRPVRLRGDRISPTGSTAPLVRDERRARPRPSWSAAFDGGGRAARGHVAAGGPSASPCSAAPAARTRTPSRGPGSPTRSASPTVDAQLGDGLPAAVLDLPRATIDEAARRQHDRAARARPQGRAAGACTCACATPPSSARSRIIEFAPKTTGLDAATRGARSRIEPGARRRSSRPRSPSTTSPSQLAAGPVVVVAGRANLAESAASAAAALRAVLDAVPRAPRCCRRCAAATSSGRCSSGCAPTDDGLDAAGILTRRRRRQDRPARAARRRPARRRARRRPRPPCPRRRPPDHRGRHVPQRLVRRRRRRARRRRLRREGGHDHQPRGPGHHGGPEGHAWPARPGPTG